MALIDSAKCLTYNEIKMIDQTTAKVRIAVIDDEKMLLSVFSSMMRHYHYHADFFSNPLKALQTIIGNPSRYHIILLDIRMPQMDGISFAKQVRNILPNLPIIFMTGVSAAEVRDQAMALGHVHFLEKPFPLDETLRDVIPKILADSAKKETGT